MQRYSMLVCGFGCELTDELIAYLERAVALVKAYRPAFVVFSGGPTQQFSAPGITEAQLMYDYVVPRCSELGDTQWLQDHDSFDSLDTIVHAKELLEARTEPGRLVTYTDASRTLKVNAVAKRKMPRWKFIQETYDLHSNPETQIIALLMELPMIYIPLLHVPSSLYRRGWRAKRI